MPTCLSGGKAWVRGADAPSARARIEAWLGEIAKRLPAPSGAPMMIDVTPVRAAPSAVIAERLRGVGEGE